MAAELIFHSGRVLTVDDRFSVAEAAAVRDGRIAATGSNAEIRSLAGPGTRRIDLAGGSLIPGINDSHLHLQWYAMASPARSLDLSDCRTLDQVRALVAGRAGQTPAAAWIRGRGWHERRLAGTGPAGPTAADLDDVCGDHPVALEHFSAHGVWVNSAALRRAGITAQTPDPPGGQIARDPGSGAPTGLLTEDAIGLVHAVIPEETPAERAQAVREAVAELNARGVTSLTDPIVTPTMLRDYLALRTADALKARITVLLHWSWPSVQTPLDVLREAMRYVGATTGLGDDLLRVGGAKLFADGVDALGTACRYAPDGRGRQGRLVTPGESDQERSAALRESIALLHRHRYQVQVHATGDRACDEVVEAFDAALTADPWPDARHVLIHANHPSPGSMTTLGRHGLVANINALIKYQAAPGLVGVLPEDDWHTMMPARSLLEAGVVLADSSDAPITDPDWRRALQMLVLREVHGSGAVSGPDERLTRAQALRAWTAAPAYQDHQEHAKGSIETGKFADLVVLAEDLLTVADHDLHAVTPVMTVLGGDVVYES